MRQGCRRLVLGFALAASVAHGMEAWIPLAEIVDYSDAGIVATLRNVREHSDADTEFGEGDLVVEKAVYGRYKAGESLPLKWSNPKWLRCPRVEYRHHAEVRALWLLRTRPDGRIRTVTSRSVIRLAEMEVGDALREIDERETAGRLKPGPHFPAVRLLLQQEMRGGQIVGSRR